MGSGTGLELRPMYFTSSEKSLYCDVSTDTVRPYVTKSFPLQIFNHIYNLSHPGVKATQKLVAARFVWNNINKDCALWGSSSCIDRFTRLPEAFPIPYQSADTIACAFFARMDF
ncbi:hypothetical protein AVEN_171307-1 [Araneus ventricosus]|uniref:Integrase zinc-binding domain-containing protein n=1 Tax=Araneus ventricosus TaxID=182803 RepID=A0A4Y2VIJ5_ARAVE|nr:hypothetical protein AVEN_171307-1 [Araneus ventricosus]